MNKVLLKKLNKIFNVFFILNCSVLFAQQIDVYGKGILISNNDTTPNVADQTNFGSTNETSGVITKVFTIQNNALLATLNPGAITFTGPNATDFFVVRPPQTTPALGGTTTFEIGFNPSALGTRNATLSFSTNVSGKNPYTFSISGTGTSFPTQSYTLYYENFDANNGGWTAVSTGGSNWQYGSTPFLAEGNYWRLGNNYANNTQATLTSPNISTANYTNIRIHVDLREDIPDSNDGMQIQYSINNGVTWNVLGAYINSESWYKVSNTNALSSSLGSTLGFGELQPALIPGVNNFVERSTQSNILDNQSNLRFRVVFNSNGSTVGRGVAVDNFFVKGDPITPFANKPLTPGNSPNNLQLWLKANNGTSTTADGVALSTWSDQANNNDAVGIGASRPIFRDGARNINYNPIVDFTDAGATSMRGKGGFYSQDYFIVVKTNNTVSSTSVLSQAPISGRTSVSSFHLDGTAFAVGPFTARYKNEIVSHSIGSVPQSPSTNSYGRAYASTTDTYVQETTIYNVKTNAAGTATEIYKNGVRIDNYAGESVATDQITVTGTLNFSEFNNLQYNLGVGRFSLNGNDADSYLDGKISEIISYSSPKSAVDKKKIESYLAIKNGITLHATNSTTATNLGDTDYLDSNGNTIWNTVANNGFNYNIAGIGRDDSSALNQKQSKSENAGTVLTIGLGDVLATNNANTNTFPTDRNFLIWGSDNGSMIDSGVDLPISLGPTTITTITEVVNRKWKVNEVNGDVPTTRVAIPTASFVSGLPALGPTDAYVMVVATNAAFTTGLETVFMSTTGGNQTCLYDFDGTKYITFGVAHRATNPLHITLDGFDDYVRVDATNDLPASFTVMTWIRPNGANTSGTERTILSKKSAAGNGYQIVLQNDNRVRFEFYNGTTLRSTVSNTAFPDAKWHNIAFTYTGSTLSIYIDGVFEKSVTTMTGPITPSTGIFSIGGQYLSKTSINNLFKGDIDELRMWDRVLTATEIQFIMNQEILESGTGTIGTIIPSTITKNDVSALLWNNLFAYYSMNSYIGTHLDDDSKNVNRGSLVIPDKISINVQTAPLPYESSVDGDWEDNAVWAFGSIQDVPHSLSIINIIPKPSIDWNIVRTKNNIRSRGNKTILGLFVNTNTVTANSLSGTQTDGTKMEVTHYLKLDGTIDLVGRSQLVQKTGSDLAVTITGKIERDQQGQANFYNYNYWGSPVGPISNPLNNSDYTVAGVLRDGTNPASPAAFQWTSSLNANNATTPRTLSNYWINKFDNLSNNYANWSRINENATLRAGQGFTLKGSGAATATQNLVFIGKPNNGTINNTVGKNQLLLVGNPYPSALNATQFINDNVGVITGNLYFWEHYSANNSHFLKDYLGGYAIRNNSGGTLPSSMGVNFINPSGTSTRVAPNQYIPVGQGFFVIGTTSGGGTTLQFNNGQRDFFKETNPDGSANTSSQTMYRTTSSKAPVQDHWTDNSDTMLEPGSNKKIHIGFNILSNNFHRQVLLAFMDEQANNDINPGYDAPNIDGSPSDMYLLNKDQMLSIQGEGYFNKEASYPIAVKMAEEGKVSFVIDNLENFDADQNYFIYDAQTDTYNSIKKGPFEVLVAKGEDKTRFALHFTDKKAVTAIEQPTTDNNSIEAVFTRYNNTLNITNGVKDATIETVQLYNIQGACIKTWDIKDKTQFYHKLPITENSSEFYIVKIKTSKGIMTQKIIVK
ncbi:LamG-like jellyroll fold domain-containing protein [Flavobacterium turcicum]|uniref:Choice-of-anchor D domain-containing protein n=1 Tax=Flavobacterium turcicum TaxID=2764718 RepID=A0ABR7JH90_9FLAO|nr:LamG-like jellyroll fold domain-containing protein [Flavobacterium turcicum]MBC5863514.1 choice-of-anchor D domain-containing protein [Flavobacterium turcicum]NHL02536.1 choice-of-anchor D domain-containing protein [Flavobacterium turcicum]